jgi:hypothetical protein
MIPNRAGTLGSFGTQLLIFVATGQHVSSKDSLAREINCEFAAYKDGRLPLPFPGSISSIETGHKFPYPALISLSFSYSSSLAIPQ